jgi:hypothetical protein
MPHYIPISPKNASKARPCLYIYKSLQQTPSQSITSPILPPRPPPLLPLSTLKHILSQFPINLIMRLTHPPPEHISPLQARLIPLRLHPRLEIVGADPARVKLGEEREELRHLRLVLGRCGRGVGRCQRVEERPGAGAQGVDVGGAVGWWLCGVC